MTSSTWSSGWFCCHLLPPLLLLEGQLYSLLHLVPNILDREGSVGAVDGLGLLLLYLHRRFARPAGEQLGRGGVGQAGAFSLVLHQTPGSHLKATQAVAVWGQQDLAQLEGGQHLRVGLCTLWGPQGARDRSHGSHYLGKSLCHPVVRGELLGLVLAGLLSAGGGGPPVRLVTHGAGPAQV